MDLEELKQQFASRLSGVTDEKSLTDFEVGFLGRKGKMTEVLRSLGSLSLEEKKELGPKANDLRDWMAGEIKAQSEKLKMKKWDAIAESEKQDINDPTLHSPLSTLRSVPGHLHPLSNFIFKVEQVFEEMGYEIVDSLDIETDYYNFTALNIPPDHPAREEGDTFYIKSDCDPSLLLKTQTSAMQVRYMKKHQPPIKIVIPGKCFRRDDDASHSPMFHQCEGLVVDKGITMADLKSTMIEVTRKLLGDDVKTRFRSSFFPFVEPGLEVDVTCTICGGKGCNVCKQTGWLEVFPAGMVHPQVLRNGGIDPDVYSGFAFGMGVDRFCMMKHKIPNIKYLYENDARFLSQF